MKKLSPFLVLFFVFGCAHSPPQNKREQKLELFLTAQKKGTEIWATSTPKEIRSAVSDYQAHKKLANGLVYGESIRNLNLARMTLPQIEPLLVQRKCRKLVDVLRDAKTGEPSQCNGSKIRQIIFDCYDGGMVRLKPDGDPCNKYRPQAHGVKSVRFPFDGDPKDYSKEAFKVDKFDLPIPKSPGMLNPAVDADGWAEDAHVDLEP